MKYFIYGDNVDTDVIIPARYLNRSEIEYLASHCMEDIDPTFAQSVEAGDIILAGNNFGCGSSREHAPIAIKGAGVSCVVAKSFARIFFRNAINIGLPIIECPAFIDEIKTGELFKIDLAKGTILNESTNKAYTFEPYPAFLLDIIEKGGLIEKVNHASRD